MFLGVTNRTWAKIYNLAITFVFFFWIFRGAHEEGHALAAYQLGIEGTVKFKWAIAHFYYPESVAITSYQNIVVSLAGGMAVALVYLLFWSAKQWALKFCPWDVDDALALTAAGLMNFLYAFSEIWNWTAWGSLIALLIGLGLAFLIYYKKLIHWLRSEEH